MYDIWPNILTSSHQWTIENNKLKNNNKGLVGTVLDTVLDERNITNYYYHSTVERVYMYTTCMLCSKNIEILHRSS